jgi:hypothetical protein
MGAFGCRLTAASSLFGFLIVKPQFRRDAVEGSGQLLAQGLGAGSAFCRQSIRPIGPLSLFAFGIGPGFQLEAFEVDKAGQVFALPLMAAFGGGGPPTYVNASPMFFDIEAGDTTVGYMVNSNNQAYLSSSWTSRTCTSMRGGTNHDEGRRGRLLAGRRTGCTVRRVLESAGIHTWRLTGATFTDWAWCLRRCSPATTRSDR